MLFNSIRFYIFFAAVFSLYWLFRKNLKVSNFILIIASCFFYGYWSWPFLLLLLATIIFNFYCSLMVDDAQEMSVRKFWLTISITAHLGLLIYFKYTNFMVFNVQRVLDIMGLETTPMIFEIILPLGISFYTFQSIGYVVDVYCRSIKSTRNIINYAIFVMFFPQLVAGPIERAGNLLKQINAQREVTLEKIKEGTYFILWGLYLKVFVADNLALLVDKFFMSPVDTHTGAETLYVLYAFSFQIYGDFAGYSLIACGLAKYLGFKLMINFDLPYFVTNPRDFWKKWHISLSSWLRDYLYIPLGGNRKGNIRTYFNLFITMFLCGLWHGAGLHFIIWGLYHAMLQFIYRALSPYLSRMPQPRRPIMKTIWFWIRVIFFFQITCIGWLIFRAGSLTQCVELLQKLIFNFNITEFIGIVIWGKKLLIFTVFLLCVELYGFINKDQFYIYKANNCVRAAFYYICLYSLIIFGASNGQEFIYFQF